MKGMELAKSYFEEYGRAMIDEKLSRYKPQIAAGLVGEGSECFGYDDELSMDHDFGPAFCIWVPEAVYRQAGQVIAAEYDKLPSTYRGMTRVTSAQGAGRVGVLPLEGFYAKFTGLDHAPVDNIEWFRIPENFLATVTNGQVFCDNLGEFSARRTALLSFYPREVVLKKLAARCAIMAQSGQYNYVRSQKRGDCYAAYLACGEFVKAALSAIYLLNEKYMPYYKWMFRGAQDLSVLKESVEKLRELVLFNDEAANARRKENLIESICVDVVGELNRRGMTRSTEAFLQVQGEELMRSLTDARLKAMHIMAD